MFNCVFRRVGQSSERGSGGCGRTTMSTQKSDMSAVAQVPANVVDSGKVSLGGGGISLIKPAVTDNGKIKIGGASHSLIRAAVADKGKIKLRGASDSLIKAAAADKGESKI